MKVGLLSNVVAYTLGVAEYAAVVWNIEKDDGDEDEVEEEDQKRKRKRKRKMRTRRMKRNRKKIRKRGGRRR